MFNELFDQLIDAVRAQREEERANRFIFFLALIGGIVAVACIAYAVYRFLTPDYFEDYDDEFDDDFDDDFDDEEEEEQKPAEEATEIPIQA